MALDRNDADVIAEAIVRANRQSGGGSLGGGSGSGGGSSGKAYTEAEKAAADLSRSLNEAKASFQNLQKTSKDMELYPNLIM